MAIQIDEAARVIDAIANFDYTNKDYQRWWKPDVSIIARDVAFMVLFLLATGVLKYPDSPGEGAEIWPTPQPPEEL